MRIACAAALVSCCAPLTACKGQTGETTAHPSTVSSSTGAPPATAGAVVSAIATATTKAPDAMGACVTSPPGGVAIAVKPKSEDFRIAAAGPKVLVTWLEPPSREGGGRRAMGRVFYGATSSVVGDARVIDQTEFGDEIMSGAAPLDVGGLAAISCFNEAPAGITSCTRIPAEGGKGARLFDVNITNFGMQEPGIAALAVGSDALIVLPEGGAGDVALFSSRGPKKRSRQFAGGVDTTPHATGLAATWRSTDEAAVVYRYRGAIFGRVGGFDEKWRGNRVQLSDAGALVGAPAIAAASDGSAVVLFASRKNAKEPWRLMRADWRGDTVTKAPFDGSAEPTQAPALAPAHDAKCMHVAWVEGAGDKTLTRVGTMCDGHVAPATIATVSSPGVEGGRAVLATSEAGTFAAWQEFPSGKPAELRVARLACK